MSASDGSTPLDGAQEMLKAFWGGMGTQNAIPPLPGMMAPTLNINELEKRITDMKAVEGWLKMNLHMLQMTIQGLELQKNTLSAIKQAGENAPSFEDIAQRFANPALWPWSLMQAAGEAAQGDADKGATTPEKNGK